MTTSTVASSVLSVSVAAPATFNAAGFGALTYTVVGELTDIGSVLGREYNIASHAPIGSAQQIQKKASYSLPNADFTVGWDEADAGQIIIAAGSNSNAVYSFKLVKQDGKIRYFTAQVMKFVEAHGTVDNIVQGMFTLLRQTDTVNV